MGNGWSIPKKKGGGYYSEHPKHGNLSSGYTEKNGKRIPSENHVHRHKDGVTVTHQGRKSSVVERYCFKCKNDTRHTTDDNHEYRCGRCGSIRH